MTPLVFSARQGDIESARIMLEHGADVNQQTEGGWTPLLAAVQNRYYKLASFLLERGADPRIQNKGGWSPLYSRPTTATSRAAIIQRASPTWTTSRSSSC